MSIKIKDKSCEKKSGPCWNDMEELKYLICAIDSWYVQFNLGNFNEFQRSKLSRVEEKQLTFSFW